VFERFEADHDVRDLHAGIVDVVLHFDRNAAEAQDPYQGVAQCRVAQMADVRRLVRIDRRVLDDRLPGVRGGTSGRRGGIESRPQKRPAIEEDVQVAIRCGLESGDALDLRQRTGQFLGDDLRRLAQPARQLERHWQRKVAERACRRVSDSERRLIGRREIVALAQERRETRAQQVVNRQNHRIGV